MVVTYKDTTKSVMLTDATRITNEHETDRRKAFGAKTKCYESSKVAIMVVAQDGVGKVFIGKYFGSGEQHRQWHVALRHFPHQLIALKPGRNRGIRVRRHH